MQTMCIFCCDVYIGEKDTNTHTFKCKCLNKLCTDTQKLVTLASGKGMTRG